MPKNDYMKRLQEQRRQLSIKDSGERTVFETGAMRDMHAGKGRMDLLPWEALIEVSKHCEEGALKYGERNCEKGIPIHSLVDSALRHIAGYMIGLDDEPHLRAAAWNILFAMYMEIKHPEMQDIPARKKEADNECGRLSGQIKAIEGTKKAGPEHDGDVSAYGNESGRAAPV